jgi:hypothetical protein
LLEDAKTEILGKRTENAWHILDRLARDLEGLSREEEVQHDHR